MTRRLVAAIALAVLAVALALPAAHADPGDHVPNQDFNLATANQDPQGITWDGTHFQVADWVDDAIYAYTAAGSFVGSFNLANGSNPRGLTWRAPLLYVVDWGGFVRAYTISGTHMTAAGFNLATANANAAGIAWDGTYFRVVDVNDNVVYTYTADGTYMPDADFDLAVNNDAPTGITWDNPFYAVADSTDNLAYTYAASGAHVSAMTVTLASSNTAAKGLSWGTPYLRVVDDNASKVFTYEEATDPDDDEVGYSASFSSAVTAHGNWKCVQKSTGQAFTVNNARLTVHGFCAQASGSGMEVEVHVAATTTFADFATFADATGRWWYIESGLTDDASNRVYDDTPIVESGAIAFAEELGGLDTSNRLGFATKAKAVTDDDCLEAENEGFRCDTAHLTNLTTSDTALFWIGTSNANTITLADEPTVPETVLVSRNADYTSATVTWELRDAVTLYQVERLTAVAVDVADASRIEYGDPVTTEIEGTQAGIDEHTDTGLEAHRTYQYRVRARGADSTSWSDWSEYVFSGAKPGVDLQPPGNLELDRDAASVIASWTAPEGSFAGYTLQRQELLQIEGSTFFGNIATLGGMWIAASDTMYTDDSIIPTQTYEYRVAAVLDDLVGAYSDWFRVGPPVTSLGAAPGEFALIEDRRGTQLYDERRQFWMGWADVAGADDYELQVVSYALAGGQSTDTRIVTDPLFFHTTYSLVFLRVRGRTLDADACSAAADDRCVTEWSAWYRVPFTPAIAIEAPPVVDDTADTSIMDTREETKTMLEEVLGEAGTTVDGGVVLQFGVVVGAMVLGGLSVSLGWRRGMAPLGVGMGCAICILVLFAGYRLWGTPIAWAIAAQAVVAVAGIVALVKQTGVLQR